LAATSDGIATGADLEAPAGGRPRFGAGRPGRLSVLGTGAAAGSADIAAGADFDVPASVGAERLGGLSDGGADPLGNRRTSPLIV
jgi:hypothetical protein